MASLKLLSAALLATAVIAAPAMAREHHKASRYVAADAYAAVVPDAYAGPAYPYGYRCVPAPRVGAFATAPWENETPCEPAFVPSQGYY